MNGLSCQMVLQQLFSIWIDKWLTGDIIRLNEKFVEYWIKRQLIRFGVWQSTGAFVEMKASIRFLNIFLIV